MSHELFDASPGVCCAAYQLGACSHTESFYDYDDDDESEAYAEAAAAQRDALLDAIDDEPF